jgi:hypothetical protein
MCTLEAVNASADSILIHLLIDGVMVANTTVAHLDSGATTVVSLTWTATVGRHTGTMVIDPLDTIPVEDPTNNTVSVTGTIREGEELPRIVEMRPFDLLWVGDVSVSPASPRTGTPVNFTANIKAVGSDINNVKVSLQIQSGRILMSMGNITVPHLSADTPQAVTIRWTGPTLGDHSAILTVEQSEAPLRSEDMTNNRIAKAFTVRKPGLMILPRAKVKVLMKPKIPMKMMVFGEAACRYNENKTVDLQITQFAFYPVPGNPHRKEIMIRIANNGLKCVRAFKFDVTDSFGQLVYSETVSPLSGKTYALTGKISRVFNFNLDEANVRQFGTCRVYSGRTTRTYDGHVIREYTDMQCSALTAHVDPGNEIRESQERNNRSKLSVHWAAYR